MDHQELINLLPLAALDRLEPEEARLLDEHLREGCAECEAELRAWRETMAALVMAQDPSGSEHRVWQRLEARLQADAAAVRSLEQKVSRPGRAAVAERRPRIGLWRGLTALAAAAAVLLFVNNRQISDHATEVEALRLAQLKALDSQVQNLRSDLTTAQTETQTLRGMLDERVRLDHVLMSPDLQLTRLEPVGPARQAGGVVAVSGASRTAMVQAFGLPPTPAGKTYELWWITKESGPIKAGLFFTRAGHATVAPASMPPVGQRLMLAAVTLEPAGGVDKPTGEMYLKGAPQRE
jgi:anti-sigma-K factor RskA